MPNESNVFENTELEKSVRSREQKRWIFKNKVRGVFFGTADKRGWVASVTLYVLLLSIGFIYLYPLLYMVSTSLMSLSDILDISVRWVPTEFYFSNFTLAFQVMDYWRTLFLNLVIAIVPAILQTVVCSLTAYGFARFKFRGKKILMAIMILTFVIPPQILMMPTYLLYFDLGFVGSLYSITLPAFFGQGLQSAVMILIFYQFYKPIPDALLEAAQIDGASQWRIYWSIGVRSAIPAIIVVFTFTFVFYWNETYLINMFLGNRAAGHTTEWTTLLIELSRFQQSFLAIHPAAGSSGHRLNEGIRFAGTLLSIAPLLLLAGFLQKHLVESIDGAGITGE